jgi:hypothetical protein
MNFVMQPNLAFKILFYFILLKSCEQEKLKIKRFENEVILEVFNRQK